MIVFDVFLSDAVHTCERDLVKKLLLITLLSVGLPLMSGCKWFGCSCSCGCHHHEVPGQAASSVIEIKSEADFTTRVLQSAKPVVVDFSATWCGACKTMKPVFEEISSELNDVTFVSVDVDVVPSLAAKYNISGIPTFICFKNGTMVGSPLVGSMDKNAFKQAIQKNIAG